ncbi:MAG: 4-demethylwyosine synthase TYW1 [DPANN group archaeon]|nr:4-demethylwyosine synthase TYW1 [DPANN group archaeon]
MAKFTQKRLKQYKNAGYRVVGKNQHSGVEVCRWAKSVMRGGRNCYKSVYGVSSHRCLQMTPTLDFCTFSCKFCWRTFGKDRFKSHAKWDNPKEIINEAIEAQRDLMSGWKGNSKTTLQQYKEALNPVHFAISLDGEPTLYPKIAELIKEVRKRGMTAFLVTNGTVPDRLQELLRKKAEPTNLYISVYATNPKDYQKITCAFIPDAWGKVLKSLKLMKKFKCRTIFRMTLVKGLNLKDAEGWAKLINMAQPKFVEFKGYTWLGESRKRLKAEDMPTMQELENFAKEIVKLTGYIIKHKDPISRVIVFARDEKVWKANLKEIGEQNYKIAKLDTKNKVRLVG